MSQTPVIITLTNAVNNQIELVNYTFTQNQISNVLSLWAISLNQLNQEQPSTYILTVAAGLNAANFFTFDQWQVEDTIGTIINKWGWGETSQLTGPTSGPYGTFVGGSLTIAHNFTDGDWGDAIEKTIAEGIKLLGKMVVDGLGGE